MENHERDNNENTVRWRNALTEVAQLYGWHFEHGYGNEQKIIGNIVKQVYTRLQRDPIRNEISDMDPEVSQTSQSVPAVSQTAHKATKVKMPISHWEFEAETAWRVVGLMSSVVGLICYALSPSFNRLIGRWKPFKVFLYVVSSLVIFTTVLFAKQSSLSTQHAQLIKTCAIFAVLMIISAYSFVYDRAANGKPDILGAVSNAAFALVSLSLHKLFKLKSEMGIFSYFLCCFTIQLLTINWMLIFVAIIYGGLLFVMHSQSQPSRGQRSHSELAAGSGGQHVIAIPP